MSSHTDLAVPACAGGGPESRRGWEAGLPPRAVHVLWTLVWTHRGRLQEPGHVGVCKSDAQLLQDGSAQWETRVSMIKIGGVRSQ